MENGNGLLRDGKRARARAPTVPWPENAQMADGTGSDVLRGTLDLLILKTLSLTPMHGWGISQRIQELSRGLLDVNQGSLYPALQRLENRGWITSRWETTENNRRAKYYRLTATGRRGLAAEAAMWRRYTGAVDWILEAT
jgi:transcriptional regulator